jgi:putative ABC transport system permease protein
MNALFLDVRHAGRMLLRSPGFALAIVVTLAFGIGGNSAIFSLLSSLLLRPLSQVEPQRVTWVFSSPDFGSFSYPDYRDLRAEKDAAFSSLAAFHPLFLSLTRGDVNERVRGEAVSDDYFATLGVRLAVGAGIANAEAGRGTPFQVVLGHDLWQDRFSGDPAVIGRAIQLNGHPFTVVGVAPADFLGAQTGFATQLWVPIEAQAAAEPSASRWKPLETRSYRWLDVVGRLRPGASIEQARGAVTTAARQLASAYPDTNRGFDRPLVVSASLGDPRLRRAQLPLFGLLMGVVALVLLIACANVANLLLARSLVRRGEIAVRQALGATRPRLLRQMLLESILLAVAGGALGLLLTIPIKNLLLSFLPSELSDLAVDLRLDGRVLAFTLIVSVLTGILFGLAPAPGLSRFSLPLALRNVTLAGRAGGRRGTRLRSILVVVQVALSLVLLTGAGLLLRTLHTQQKVDPGFDPQNVLLLAFDLSLRGYDEARGETFQRTLTDDLKGLPGVRSVSLATLAPLGLDTTRKSVAAAERTLGPGELPLNVLINSVSADHLRTLGIPLLRGRDFTAADRADTPLVAIINEELAERLWPGQDPIGRRISFPAPPAPGSTTPRLLEPDVTIVGLARNSKYVSLGERPQPYLYQPLSQRYQPATLLFVRTEGSSLGMIDGVRKELRRLDPFLPVYEVRLLSEQVGASLWSVRLSATLCAVFGLFALLLSALGLYSVLAQAVAQRIHEIGVRMALGAERSEVFRMILWQSLRLTLIGVAVGLVAALLLARGLSSLLFDVSSADPLTFAVVTLVLAAVACLASYLPARRAVQVDPVVALRAD